MLDLRYQKEAMHGLWLCVSGPYWVCPDLTDAQTFAINVVCKRLGLGMDWGGG
jgi:hypothetical protein